MRRNFIQSSHDTSDTGVSTPTLYVKKETRSGAILERRAQSYQPIIETSSPYYQFFSALLASHVPHVHRKGSTNAAVEEEEEEEEEEEQEEQEEQEQMRNIWNALWILGLLVTQMALWRISDASMTKRFGPSVLVVSAHADDDTSYRYEE